ncbi:NADAR family protein [Paraburkholderia graminis]|uniref:RibA/ribD-fused uncharacterized protein n=1 Tax=Paraburkholderia graminis TaxID=60548 RepID=A0ABD5CT18_9BURK|nr:NADAR family protein [Paraburkholderia graminis]MDR6208299.1 ribA/ribD-fused uncharacterized protein [Paraburkholderia graminis]
MGNRALTNIEQYMMWRKAKLFGNDALAADMLAASNPRKLKAMGRAVEANQADVWERERMRGWWTAVISSCRRSRRCAMKLLAIGERMLVEASPDDGIWGIYLAEDDPRALDPEQWLGRNLLGHALMAVRRLLRHGGQPAGIQER